MKYIKIFEDFSKLTWDIFAGLGGGFGGAKLIKRFVGTREEAEREAYLFAVEDYESYEGLHGLRSVKDIMEEDNVDESEAEMIYNDEMESWLDYYVREVKEEISESNDANSQLDNFNGIEDKIKSSSLSREKILNWKTNLEKKYPLLGFKFQKGNDTIHAEAFIK